MAKLDAKEMAEKMRRRKLSGPTISDLEAYEIPIDNIKIEKQVRQEMKDIEELAESIKNEGLIQPIIVEQREEGYLVIVGERRIRAAMLLGWKEIPAIIKARSTRNRMFTQLIENLQRSDLHPIEIAAAAAELKNETGLTEEEIANKIGKKKPYISKCMSIRKLLKKVEPEELYGISLEVLYMLSTRINERDFRTLLEKAKEGATVKRVKEMIDEQEIRAEKKIRGKIKRLPPIKIKEVTGDKDLRISLSIGKRMAAGLDEKEKEKLKDQVGKITRQLTGLIPVGAKIGVTITMETKKEKAR